TIYAVFPWFPGILWQIVWHSLAPRGGRGIPEGVGLRRPRDSPSLPSPSLVKHPRSVAAESEAAKTSVGRRVRLFHLSVHGVGIGAVVHHRPPGFARSATVVAPARRP